MLESVFLYKKYMINIEKSCIDLCIYAFIMSIVTVLFFCFILH